MKSLLRYIFRFLVFLLIFVFVLISLLYIPAVQTMVKNKASVLLSDKTGWNIEIDHFHLSFPLNIGLTGINIRTVQGDTLFNLASFETGVVISPLFKGQVVIDKIALSGLQSNMTDLIDGINLSGHVNAFVLQDIRVNLSQKSGDVKHIRLTDSNVKMELFETPEDTLTKKSSPIEWSFRIGQLAILRTGYSLKMSGKGIDLSCFIGKGILRQGKLLLEENKYTVQGLQLSNASYSMNMDSLPLKPGFDPAHMHMTDINITAQGIYNQGSSVKAFIKNASMNERSGFKLSSLSGAYAMDSSFMQISDLKLSTPYSNIDVDAFISQSVFAKPRKGKLSGKVDAKIGKEEILFFTNSLSTDFAKYYPNQNLKMKMDLSGDMKRLDIRYLTAELPGSFLFDVQGYFNQLDNEKATSADLLIKGDFTDISFVPRIMPDTSLHKMLAIPKNIHLNGKLLADQGQYIGNLTLDYEKSALNLRGSYHPSGEQYSVALKADNFLLDRFLPNLGFGVLDMTLNGSGAGFDPLLPSAFANIEANVHRMDIRKYSIQQLTLNGNLEKSHYKIVINGADTILAMAVDLDGILSKQEITANLKADLKRIDLYNLKLLSTETVISGLIEAKAYTDLKQIYQLDATVDNMRLRDRGVLNKLGNLALKADIDADSTKFSVQSGDFILVFDAAAGIDSLLSDFNQFNGVLAKHINERQIDVMPLQQTLPEMILQLSSGTQNALYGYIKSTGLRFKNLNFLIANEHEDGLRLNGVINDFRRDTLLLNTIDLSLLQRQNIIEYQLSANSLNKNPIKAFIATATGAFASNALSLHLLQKNGKNQIGFDVGLNLQLTKDDATLRFESLNPIMLYRNWTVNRDNYITLTKENHIRADFLLTGEKGMQLSVISQDSLQTEDANKLDVGIQQFELAQISEAFPNLPAFSGMFNAQFHVVLNHGDIDATGTSTLDSLIYNKRLMGNLDLALQYAGSKEKGQKGNASIRLDKREILQGNFVDLPIDTAGLYAHLNLFSLPLKLADPFIPSGLATLSGSISGNVIFLDSIAKPIINGELDMDSASVTVSYAKATYWLDEQPLIIKNNQLFFRNYKLKAYNSEPIVLNGDLNFSNLNQITTNLQITGQNVELLNVKKQPDQMVFGKMLLNVNTTVSGPINFLKIRGNLNLLAGTNMTYVMLDSPVSAQNRVANLVTFTSFNDTIDSNYVLPSQATLSGIDMLVTVNIAPSVQLGIDLSTNGDDHVELQGGGDLAFRLTPMGETDLSGRYNLSGGYVRYNIPILPIAKTFNIRNGSYVEWSGNLLDPYINITAFETIRSTVTEEGKGSRNVTFEALILIQNRLDNLSVTFTVEAPEDLTIQNQLASMTPEERSRQAMNLIITKVYTGPGTTSKVNSNNALNAFIQKEINQFTGNTLKGVDLSFGIDTYNQYGNEGESGKRTDYSFRFSKKFFNDRFRIMIGGKVSSGQNASNNMNQNFIDDISIEYMLDKSGSRYLKLFHHTGFESVLEGEIIETGIGIVLQRKIRKLRQLFIFNEERRRRAIEKEPEQKTQPAATQNESKK